MKFIFNMASGNSHDSAPGDDGFADRISALNQQSWNNLYFLPHVRLDEMPFILDVAFQSYLSDAYVLKEIGGCTRGAGTINV